MTPFVLLLLGVGCSHERLLPGKNARVLADAPLAAVATVNGVRVVTNCDDWHGLKGRLPDGVTPIKVRIVNHSGHDLRVLYQSFELVGNKGRVYRVLPVVPLEHATLVKRLGPVHPIYATTNFRVAARYHDIYPTLDSWPTPLDRDEATYSRTYREWGDAPPEREILRMAMPEGVLGPEGEITGYLYFENPLASENRLSFEADMDAGKTGTQVASIAIPLRVD